MPMAFFCQEPQKKEIVQGTQSWFSINTVTKFQEHWGLVADAHIRSDNFLKENNFYFLRGGFTYLPNVKMTFTMGYAHMWLAPSNPEWSTYSDENRIYQQFQLNTLFENVGILQRIRIEQRWQEKIVDDKESGNQRYTNRIRYLAFFGIPVFKKKNLPILVVSDEILVHFGNEVVYNTFDQNRFFIGIKQSINSKLSFDFGYMNVFQQKYSGYQYDMNHTLRLFFYFNSVVKDGVSQMPYRSGDE
ncbi:MAG TPA: DUF2490 domain-containing protein [Flavobacterium sp.]|uniref:DUF2490 domain-containing protein n=1 Tax=Flavobacterium sp. TaxID=239 RepID=UPI002BA9FD00|nr:DUF2490 domain-containing protein [Flavobacterium sp.]HSD13025.1 DUF2490 domain-containing protein [Flavobacterium sp.]